MKKRVAPSAALEAAIEELLSEGLGSSKKTSRGHCYPAVLGQSATEPNGSADLPVRLSDRIAPVSWRSQAPTSMV